MKKIFIALSVLAALAFGVGSALAVPGTPDAVPGTNFTVPFLVSDARVTGGSGPTTLLNFSEVRGSNTDIHYYFYDVRSNYVADAWVPITHWGTIMADVAITIQGMSVDNRARLSITYEGLPYYAGYIIGESSIWQWNFPVAGIWQRVINQTDNLIASLYMLDLSQGLAAASNLPMREFINMPWVPTPQIVNLPFKQIQNPYLAAPGFLYPWTILAIPILNPDMNQYQDYWTQWAITGTSPNLTAAALMPTAFGSFERWSPVALHAAGARVLGRPIDVELYGSAIAPMVFPTTWYAPANGWFAFYPEYYILDATGQTVFILWQSGLPNGTWFHMFVINDAEDYLSTTVTINEVNYLDAEPLIPDGLTVVYPYSGIFNWTDGIGSSATASQLTWFEFLGWSWQSANNGAASAATNWSILKQMARDAGTSGPAAMQPMHIVP